MALENGEIIQGEWEGAVYRIMKKEDQYFISHFFEPDYWSPWDYFPVLTALRFIAIAHKKDAK